MTVYFMLCRKSLNLVQSTKQRLEIFKLFFRDDSLEMYTAPDASILVQRSSFSNHVVKCLKDKALSEVVAITMKQMSC